jgi:hypothetical protein
MMALIPKMWSDDMTSKRTVPKTARGPYQAIDDSGRFFQYSAADSGHDDFDRYRA